MVTIFTKWTQLESLYSQHSQYVGLHYHLPKLSLVNCTYYNDLHFPNQLTKGGQNRFYSTRSYFSTKYALPNPLKGKLSRFWWKDECCNERLYRMNRQYSSKVPFSLSAKGSIPFAWCLSVQLHLLSSGLYWLFPFDTVTGIGNADFHASVALLQLK